MRIDPTAINRLILKLSAFATWIMARAGCTLSHLSCTDFSCHTLFICYAFVDIYSAHSFMVLFGLAFFMDGSTLASRTGKETGVRLYVQETVENGHQALPRHHGMPVLLPSRVLWLFMAFRLPKVMTGWNNTLHFNIIIFVILHDIWYIKYNIHDFYMKDNV